MDNHRFKPGTWLDKLNQIHDGRLAVEAVEEHRKILWFRTKEQAAKDLFHLLVDVNPFKARAKKLGLI